MRTVDSSVVTEVAKNAVHPFHIARIYFGVQLAFISEGPSFFFEGQNYIADSMELKGVNFDQGGFSSGSMDVLDYNGSSIAIALNEKVSGCGCEVWLVYKKSDGSFTVPAKIIEGNYDVVEISQDKISLSLYKKNSIDAFFPDVYFNKDSGATHLIAKGTIIEWDGEKIEMVN